MDGSDVTPFPPQLRVVRAPVDALEDAAPALVEHNSRACRLSDLPAQLRPLKLARVEAAAPRSGQEAWDMVVRSWPALADEIAAACVSAGQ